jgi:hydroxypyruvate reductase/glycerate 2-kinase
MSVSSSLLVKHARAIWDAAVAAVKPAELVKATFAAPPPDLRAALDRGGRILIVGGGKAGAAMAAGAEAALADCLDRVAGVVNVPAGAVRPLRAVRLHPGRPEGVNRPTAEGVTGVHDMLDLVRSADGRDVGLCLLSGGGSALLPAPIDGVSLEDKQHVTELLHACGANIGEMNCVRKHLSAFKGGRLAQAFVDRGCPVFTLIVSDVVGDPLDVIASGPTAADPTTFGDAWDVLHRYGLAEKAPAPVVDYLRKGRAGEAPETPKQLSPSVHNLVIGNNAIALQAAKKQAEALGYAVVNLGSLIEGETKLVACGLAEAVRSVRRDGVPARAPACILSGGETTVTLGDAKGRGGRNQEFVLAAVLDLGEDGLRGAVVLSGGTDGEDGPTDAAGAWADAGALARATSLGLDPAAFLERHDSYSFFDAVGGLLRTGLTGTNVMDVRVILIGE